MSGSKRMLEKQELLYLSAIKFLNLQNFIDEAMDGTICSKVAPDNAEVYIKANDYFKEHLGKEYSLGEFRDCIKKILSEAVNMKVMEYEMSKGD